MTAKHDTRSGSKPEGSRHIPALSGAGATLVSALLFSITTPLAKQLLSGANPLLIAGLLYAGSGLGLTLLILAQDRGHFALGLAPSDLPWLAAAVASGGVLAPALLMFGLARGGAAAASLLLNLESVFTAVMAWVFCREATSRGDLRGQLALVWPASLTGNQSVTALRLRRPAYFGSWTIISPGRSPLQMPARSLPQKGLPRVRPMLGWPWRSRPLCLRRERCGRRSFLDFWVTD